MWMLEIHSLGEMIEWGLKRHPYSLTEEEILEALRNIDQVEESPEGIDTLKCLGYWELKVMDLKECLADYKQKKNKSLHTK